MEFFKTITCEKLIQLSDSYTGKNVEVAILPIQSNNIYQQFRLRDIGDELEFYDINIGKPTLNELVINKSNIKEIHYYGSGTYDSVFEIILENGSIEFCVSEKPIICCGCGNVLESNEDQIWNLDQMGGYFSDYDMERIVLNLCDDCLKIILYMRIAVV
jgi:hypothetical protein